MNYVLIAVPTKMQYINGKTKTKSVKRSVSVTVLMISEKSKNCKMIKLFHVFDIDVPYYLLNKKKKKKPKRKKKKKMICYLLILCNTNRSVSGSFHMPIHTILTVSYRH